MKFQNDMNNDRFYFSSDDKSQSSSSSDNENLPYPYNALPESNWAELKQQLKRVNALLHEVDKDSKSDKPLKHQVPLHSKIFAARLLSISQQRHSDIDIESVLSGEKVNLNDLAS